MNHDQTRFARDSNSTTSNVHAIVTTLIIAFVTAVSLVGAASAFASESAAESKVEPKTETKADAKTFTFLPDLPQRVKATYRITKAGLTIGTVEESFERIGTRGDQYRITSRTRAEGAAALIVRDQLTYTSSGRITAQGLVPQVFTSERSGRPDKNFTTRFDWPRNEIIREHLSNGQTERDDYPLGAGTQDRLSIMYQFMVATPKRDAITILMTQGREAEEYRYVKRGEPALNMPAGNFETVQYARDAKPGESKAELWLAKGKNFVPVRMIFTDPKGSSLEQQLTELVIQ